MLPRENVPAGSTVGGAVGHVPIASAGPSDPAPSSCSPARATLRQGAHAAAHPAASGEYTSPAFRDPLLKEGGAGNMMTARKRGREGYIDPVIDRADINGQGDNDRSAMIHNLSSLDPDLQPPPMSHAQCHRTPPPGPSACSVQTGTAAQRAGRGRWLRDPRHRGRGGGHAQQAGNAGGIPGTPSSCMALRREVEVSDTGCLWRKLNGDWFAK